MNRINSAAAVAYARERLRQGLSPQLSYHSIEHTFSEVMPAAQRIGELEGLNAEELALLAVAAAFHDIGWTVQGVGHEAYGVRVAHDVLPGFGYSAPEIERIAGMILATRLPQKPHNLLEEIVVDADMSALGSSSFWQRSDDLRRETAMLGRAYASLEWNRLQLGFLEQHRYFTAGAQALYLAQKQRNEQALRDWLAQQA